MENFLLAQAGGNASYLNLVFIGLMFVILYFFMIRPQMKARKKQAAFLTELGKGDKVILTNGIHGKIVELSPGIAQIAIDPKTVITINREFISMELSQRLKAADDKAAKTA